MSNWGFLSIIFSFFSLGNLSEDKIHMKESIIKNGIKAMVSAFFLIFFIIALIKIYEVPVYVTKIDLVTQNCKVDDQHKMDIRIYRNFDRADKGSLMRDSVWKKYNTNSRYSGGIYVTGKLLPDYYMVSEDAHVIKKINDNLDNIVKEKKLTLPKDPQIAYLSIQTSMRQSFFPKIHAESLETSSHDSCEVTSYYYDGDVEDSITYRVNNYVRSDHYKSSPNGYLRDYYYVASETDSIPFYGGLMTSSFGAPSMIRTAEDISKIVEVVYLGNLDKSKKKQAGAWAFTKSLVIDYEGPTEFSEHIYPEPDSMTISSIIYKDKKKIELIGRKGLRYHANFPDMENRQESRIFVLSGIVTGLCALLTRYLWRLLRDFYSIYRDKLENRPKVRRWIKTLFIICVVIVVLWVINSIMGSSVDPYDLYNPVIE